MLAYADSDNSVVYLNFWAGQQARPKLGSTLMAAGAEKTGLDALRLAEQNKRPFLALEDGFIRSVGLGQKVSHHSAS